MQPKKFIAIDIDGTLYDDHDHFDQQRFNRDYQLLYQKGILMVVATGNSYDAVQQIFKDTPMNTFVAENGGRIVINDQDTVSHVHPRNVLTALLSFITNQNYHPDLFSFSGANHTFIQEQFRDVPVPFYPHHRYFTTMEQIDEPVYNVNLNWFKQRPALDDIQQIIQTINTAFPEDLCATYSGGYGIDILPLGVNKAAGLRELIQSFPDRSLADVIAFGDTSNDLEMIKESGIGFAMKNATADLIQVADRITHRDNNHDGLLYEIEQLFLD